ncbi:glycerol-3-phosphate dehydrogenase [Pelagibacterium lacus]|uniref:Glycerol-3-phosphate dehydrogenase n=1 Tax=Pelagibacterium lacus TaxID=2282655 RepID=A0A369W2W9_9HYPH|nr:glycerol-3-phosphate dehydrogenase [Pelagibacterium lacus]RDE09016.1 glycerol-3-phosphate dehydrogenase [Pelagibacterium lacus]
MTSEQNGPQGRIFDLLVIGGGVNGTGIARDAAGRGYAVCLAEMDDLASGTSSASTKLIHGGLRYLEHYEFRLVRESLVEREVLWANAPHIIWPLRFVLPHHKGLRPKWLLRAGLFLYDHIGGRKLLPRTRRLDLRRDPLGRALKPGYGAAFEYSDCWVDDARLVVLNAQDAAARGAEIHTRTKVLAARRKAGHWAVTVEDGPSGTVRTIAARMLINAAGPWVEQALATEAAAGDRHAVRLVKGSHIVVPRIHDDRRAFFFQNSDGRIFFAIPYEDDFTLIGTTDEDFEGDPGAVAISDAEIDYLIAGANDYFAEALGREDVIWCYSGVRPLYNDGAGKAQEATRDYVLKLTGEAGQGQLLTVIGGKITTYRRLAEAALEHVETVLGPKGAAWTRTAPLPGGDFPVEGVGAEIDRLAGDYPFLSREEAVRLMRHYGTRARALLGAATSRPDLGFHFGAGLYAAEVDYLVASEWARTVEDILWRRTKLGLRAGAIDIDQLAAYLRAADPGNDDAAGGLPLKASKA